MSHIVTAGMDKASYTVPGDGEASKNVALVIEDASLKAKSAKLRGCASPQGNGLNDDVQSRLTLTISTYRLPQRPPIQRVFLGAEFDINTVPHEVQSGVLSRLEEGKKWEDLKADITHFTVLANQGEESGKVNKRDAWTITNTTSATRLPSFILDLRV